MNSIVDIEIIKYLHDKLCHSTDREVADIARKKLIKYLNNL